MPAYGYTSNRGAPMLWRGPAAAAHSGMLCAGGGVACPAVVELSENPALSRDLPRSNLDGSKKLLWL